jgi:AAHS family 4-hydroxybenzoate transporter-like MFS transporter
VRFTAREEHLEGFSPKHLFNEGRALPTLLLWVPSFLGFGALAVAVLWIPTLMHLAGLPPATTSVVIGVTGLGGFIGNGLSGKLLDRFGLLLVPVPALFFGAVATAAFGYFAGNVVMAAICGFFTNALLGMGVTCGIVMAAAIYPVAVRSTGIGWAMGAGRSGQVVAPLITGLTLAWGWNATEMMTLIAAGGVIGSACMVWLHIHLARRQRPDAGTALAADTV